MCDANTLNTGMHDAKGRELKIGDVVLMPCRIKAVYTTPDFCNVSLETIGGRSPDGQRNTYANINTKQLIRANDGDDSSYATFEDNSKTFLR
jgi:hypothetical protein